MTQRISCHTEMEIALQAANIGGQIVRNNLDRTLNVNRKKYLEVVTDVDHEANAAITEYLQKVCPHCSIFSEESPTILGTSDLTWIVDPLDGTSNYVLGIPHAAVSIALCNTTQVLLGVVINPFRMFQYCAKRQAGAMLNGRPLLVSQVSNLGKATIAHIVSYEEKRKTQALNLLTHLRSVCFRVLDTWSPSLDWCLLAQGKVDALVSLGSSKVDRVAGALIAREAGGVITDLEGEPPDELDSDFLLASNGTGLHSELLKIISHLATRQFAIIADRATWKCSKH
jgi:myo-inositol-1(or 4)-monophosphatase